MWKCQPSDLDLSNATPVGAGALSYVLRTQHVQTGATVAVKVLSKVQLLQQGKVEAVMNEKCCLYDLGPHPFIARLYGTAQSDDELYFVMEYLPHGDLLQHIRTVAAERAKVRSALLKQGVAVPPSFRLGLTFRDMQLIAAQLVTALSHCFSKGYVLRDLKPENIVFDSDHRCVLIDFDTTVKDGNILPHTNHGKAVKEKEPDHEKRRKTVSEIQAMRRMTSNFCGTAQYVSPEMVGECSWSYCSDLWALGVIMYQCLYATYPFRGANTFTVMKKLINGVRPEKHFAEGVDLENDEGGAETSASASKDGARSRFQRVKSFISGLLRVDPTLRLGVDPLTLKFNVSQLRTHPFFDDFDWSVVDLQLREYSFPGPVESLSAAAARNNDPGMETKLSFAPLMHDVPKHSEEYASFVFRASSSVNPFEEWSHRALGEDGAVCDTSEVVLDSEDEAILNPQTAHTSGEGGEVEEGESQSSSDSFDDVIDDVGEQPLTTNEDDFKE